jgi:hypothetical protein
MIKLVITYGLHNDCLQFGRSLARYLKSVFTEESSIAFFDLSTFREKKATLHVINKAIKPRMILDLHENRYYSGVELGVTRELEKIAEILKEKKLIDRLHIYSYPGYYPSNYADLEVLYERYNGHSEFYYVKRVEAVVESLLHLLT